MMRRAQKDRSRNSVGISSEDVLAAARSAFALRGYKETNLGDVAAVLNVTRQAIYYYFPTKQDILSALLNEFFDELQERVSAAAAAETSSPMGSFERMLRAHIEYVASVPELSAIFTREMNGLEDNVRSEIEGKRRSYHRAFVRQYERAMSGGDARVINPNAVVSLLLGAANSAYRWFRPDKTGGLSVEDFASLALDLFARGYEPSIGQGQHDAGPLPPSH